MKQEAFFHEHVCFNAVPGRRCGFLALIRAQHPQLAAALDQASLLAALRHCGIAFWQDGRLDEAAQMLSAAAAVAPNNPTILAELGCLLRLQGKTAEAMQCFLDSLALNPRQVQVWLNAASLNNETGDKSAAEKAYGSGQRRTLF